MKRLIFASAIVLLLASCSKDSDALEFLPIRTGVMLEHKEIILADRNVGAGSAGSVGRLVSYDDANSTCPKGWRLINTNELGELSKKYSANQYVDVFKFPKEGSDFYALWAVSKNSIRLISIQENDNGSVWFLISGGHNEQLPVRCVQDY